jgi:CRP-like cAMP-binding protein
MTGGSSPGTSGKPLAWESLVVYVPGMGEDERVPEESLGLVERVAALHRIQLFAGIPGRVLASVAEGAVEKRFATGELLMEDGAVEAHLYAIVEGRVKIHRGDRTIVELGPGATVGELAVLIPAPRAASVTAIEPTHVLRVDQAVLDELLVERPELALGVIAELVSRLRASSEFADQVS